MKTVKWHKGVRNMISKRDAKKEITTFMIDGSFKATKSNFTLLATRSGIGGWKNAVDAIVNQNDRSMAKRTISDTGLFWLTKNELRRAANLL